MTGPAYVRVTQRLGEVTGYQPPREGGAWRCPAHDDRNPSMTVSNGDGRVLVNCHSQRCSFGEIRDALGLADRDFFDEPQGRTSNRARIVATYPYTDEAGALLFEVVRFDPKDFRQRRPDGAGGWDWKVAGVRRVPYRLPRVIEAAAAGGRVFVVEGEKDVEALERAGEVATCNPGGAGKWRPEFAGYLAGAGEVVIVRDKDPAGIKHAADIEASLVGKVERVVVVEAATGKDAAEHVGAGHGPEEFRVVDDVPDDHHAGDLDHAGPEEPDSWSSVDLAALRASGMQGQPEPTVLRRDDGVCLFYDGKVHGLLGESESGKSWAACFAGLDVIRQGDPVTFLDFEDDAVSVTSRMLALGATWDELIDLFDYRRPDEPFALEHLADIQKVGPRFVILDGVTEAMTLHDLDPDKNRDSARFHKMVIRPIVTWTGAGVIQVDHLGKNAATRGKGAIGAQHKRAAITGAQYIVEIAKPIGRGRTGTIVLTIDKDRPGHVRRSSAGAIRGGELELTSSDDGLTVTATLKAAARAPAAFRPTVLMEKVSRRLELMGADGMTKNTIRREVTGNAEAILVAVDILVAEGYLEVHKKGQAHQHISVRPYRREDDPLDPDNVGSVAQCAAFKCQLPGAGAEPYGWHLCPDHAAERVQDVETFGLDLDDGYSVRCRRCGGRATNVPSDFVCPCETGAGRGQR